MATERRKVGSTMRDSATLDSGRERLPGRMRWALLVLLVLLLPIQFVTNSSIRFAPADAVLIVLLLASVFVIATKRDDWSVWHLVLLGVFSASLLNAAFLYGTVTSWAIVNKYAGILLLLLLYLMVVQYAGSLRSIWRIAQVLVLGVVLQASVALPLYFAGLFYAPLHVARIQALAGDPNAYGGLLVVALALHWSTVYSPGRLVPRLLSWPVTLVLMGNLVFSFSRSGWIAYAFLVCAILVLRPRAWPHVVLPIVLGSMFVAVFMRGYFVNSILPLMLRPDQVSGRMTIIENAVHAFVQHPIFGGGLGSYLAEQDVQVHNSFFWMLADVGMVGALALVGLVGVLAVRGYKAYRAVGDDYRGLVIGLFISHLTMIGLSLGIEALYQRTWWVVMALLNACWVLTVRRAEATAKATAKAAPVDASAGAGAAPVMPPAMPPARAWPRPE